MNSEQKAWLLLSAMFFFALTVTIVTINIRWYKVTEIALKSGYEQARDPGSYIPLWRKIR